MNNPHGKAFEDKLRRTAKSLGWYALRLPTPTSYYTLRMPGDFILFTPKTTLLVECKATKHKKYRPSSMRQYDKFKEFAQCDTQGRAVLLVDFIDDLGEHLYSYCDQDDIDGPALVSQQGVASLKDLLQKIEQEAYFLCT